jgi:hypothetical protein
VSPGFEAQQSKKPVGLQIDQSFGHVAQAADELKIFQTGKVGVNVSLLGDITERSTVSLQIVTDTLSFKKHLAVIGFKQTSNNLDSGGFARAVGANVADDFAGADTKTNILNRGKTSVTFAQRSDLEHKKTSHPYVAFVIGYSIRNKV